MRALFRGFALQFSGEFFKVQCASSMVYLFICWDEGEVSSSGSNCVDLTEAACF